MVLSHEHDAVLERAIKRAQARHIIAEPVTTTADGPAETHYFRVASFSQGGVDHGVMLRYTSAGVETQCSCEGGLNGRICQHVAAALMALESPQVEPDPEPISRGRAALDVLNGTDE